MKAAIISFALFACVATIGAGVLAVRGLASATAWALDATRPIVEAVPIALAPGRLGERLDAAIVALRDGRVDGGAVRETLLWLPSALLDGQLDRDEVALLERNLDRILAVPGEAPPDGAPKPAG